MSLDRIRASRKDPSPFGGRGQKKQSFVARFPRWGLISRKLIYNQIFKLHYVFGSDPRQPEGSESVRWAGGKKSKVLWRDMILKGRINDIRVKMDKSWLSSRPAGLVLRLEAGRSCP